ncbi:mechanosensitive ion channel domain-containing protein [Bythopirellula goksoeyrii]|uniref:mechanosensitive ion channel domain-containing protein n=1 Tax=Bythopirellula goksoeyrii TaxID=1400387 RepID=UPI00143D5E3E|nr:mechanosensitive ion channel domain-containing protein [Bythopirellula goksoeyrii]
MLQAECSQERARIESAIDNVNEKGRPGTKEILAEELELWEQLDLLVAQRLSTIEDRIEVYHQLQLKHEQQLTLETDESPHSFLRLDDQKDALLEQQRDVEVLELEREAEQSLLLDSKNQLYEAESKRRQAQEDLEFSSPSEANALQSKLVLLELRCRVLGCNTDLHRERCELLKQSAVLANAKMQALEVHINAIAGEVRFSAEELEERLGLIGRIQKQAKSQLKEAEHRLRKASRRRSQEDSSSLDNTEFETAREETELLQQLLTEISGVRDCWQRRFQFANKDFESGEPSQWLSEAIASKRRIDRLADKLNFHRMHWQNAAMTLERKSNSDEIKATERAEIESKLSDIQQAIEFYSSTQVLAAGGQRLFERFIDELQMHFENQSWQELVQRITASLDATWNYEIASIDDRPITISKICCGLALLFLGYWSSRLVSNATARRVMPRCGISPTAIAPLRTVLFYSLLIVFAFVSLEVVNVPLTVFTFLGGAIAIGVGFGSQNILNNFISGLILLAERPIRIGDLVNIEGIDANVEHIGARSTRVRTGANLEILVPNSKFLENNVTNWTLSDSRSRTSLTVGVAYGSPVRKVIEILDSTIRNHPKVITEPEPIVLFKNFGDSALEFEVHFWIQMKRMMEAAKVQSDLRVEIDDRFNEEGIVIAFPQTDVHLDLQKPLDIRVSKHPMPRQNDAYPMRAA